jgi:UDP-2,3-diacylglucosamine hydrolase
MLRESTAGGDVTLLFISDLHLDAAWPAACAQFSAFLRGEAREAEALYILGDLFELWVGDDDDDPLRNAVSADLAALTRSGTACFIMHGNRDFLLGARFAAASGCQLLDDPVLLEVGGQRVLVTHGDLLCREDDAYQQLRAQVRRPAWQRRFLRLPLATRRLVAGAARAGSRRHMQRAQPEIMDVAPDAVVAAMRATGARTLVHGHTHRPAVHEFELDGAPARRIVLGAWYEQGSCLRWSDAGYVLETLARGGPE